MSDVSTTTAAIYQAVLDSLNSSGECGVLPPAPPGKSAYEVAVDNGFVGSEKQWLNSLTIEQENEIARLEARIVNAEKITKGRKYAASRLVGDSNGNVPEVNGNRGLNGSGIGGINPLVIDHDDTTQLTGVYRTAGASENMDPSKPFKDWSTIFRCWQHGSTFTDISFTASGNKPRIAVQNVDLSSDGLVERTDWAEIYTTANTKLGTNGELKPSSPVLEVYHDKIIANGDGERMAATFTKNGVGDYTITGTTGLRTDGWHVTIPNDMNGNPKVAIGTLDDTDGVITLKTYVRTFDMTTFKFGPDLKKPLDIPEGRWIDLRFNDLPEELVVEPEEEPIVEEEVPVEEDPKD